MSDILTEITAPLAFVSLNRPQKRNALSSEMWQQLPVIAANLAANDAVRVVLLRAVGGAAFSAGADIAEMQAKLANNEAMRDLQQATQVGQEAWSALPKPTIALIDGACVGGGCGLAMCCDLRLATPDSYFAVTPAKLGLAYSLTDTLRLVDLVGPAHAKQILFTGGQFSAEHALKIGLVNRLIAKAELEPAGRELANNIAAQAQNSVQIAKRMVNDILGGQRQETVASRALFTDSFSSAQFKEGAQAFLQKRPPQF